MNTRSVVYLAIAAVLAPFVFGGRLQGGDIGFVAAFCAVWLVGAISFVGLIVTVIRLNAPSLRPSRFTLSPKGFHARPAIRPAALAPWLSASGANELGALLESLDADPEGSMIRLVADCVLVLFYAALAAFVFRRVGLILTPEGMTRGVGPFRHRFVAWDELLPGGPRRPHPGDSRLPLATRSGPRSVSTQLNVHPWFVADAIRWYVEHPEHRAAIGTQEEHARLLAAVASGG